MATQTPSASILAAENRATREEIVELLTRAYWMELETVTNYLACSVALEGVRAQQIAGALAAEVDEELGHARLIAARSKQLYGVVPGSLAFTAEQTFLQPPERANDVVHVIRGVIEAETAAIEHYARIVHATDGVDYVTQDQVIGILRDEEAHLRTFEGFLREYEDEHER